MLSGKYFTLYNLLTPVVDKTRIFHDPLHTLAFGTDASFYRLIPQMVIRAKNEHEISFILNQASKLGIAVTFRAAGTSLSGQAVTDSLLVIAGDNWRKAVIENDGMTIRLQPGLTGSEANRLLMKYGRKIGPDPASIDSAMIGGIAANNASGMCCGISENSYRTLKSMKIIFADGTLLDSSDMQSIERFKISHSKLLAQIGVLHSKVMANKELSQRIRHKYQIKNTTGYSLNALIDYDDPFEIIQHLMIGSEGTLGFISEITYRTVVEEPYKASSLLLFDTIYDACKAVVLLQSEKVSAVELIDRAGLRSLKDLPGLPESLLSLGSEACALLVESRAQEKELLDHQILEIEQSLLEIPLLYPMQFSHDPVECANLWKIRKGLFPTIGAMRQKGTTVIIEDVAFPLLKLAEATIDLQKIFAKWGYNEAVLFGHALMGNLHFVFTQDFNIPSEIERYRNLMSEVADLVVNRYDGSLKAEHGTGRNMAPFVEMEWGAEAYQLMKEIKKIFDPENLLNPGVILNNDEKIHLKNLKPLPIANDQIDSCIECGFCEPKCVSTGLTLSPRQRIVIYREMMRLKKSGQEPYLLASLSKSYHYTGDDTCATDGLCALACPVKIDTGKLIKEIRHYNIGDHNGAAFWIARRMNFVTTSISYALNAVSFIHMLLGDRLMNYFAAGFRRWSGNRIPLWTPSMPSGAKKIKRIEAKPSLKQKVVYFPSCINRSMGLSKEQRGEIQLTDKIIELLHKANFDVIFPEDLSSHCCGMAFLSKGYTSAGMEKSKALEKALLKASKNGEYPVLCDMSPCLFTMKENMAEQMKLYEPVEFILKYLVPQLRFTPVKESVVIFPVCSMKKMGLENQLEKLARMCAEEVVIADTNCCGFAGDRGFTFPELNKHGLRLLKEQVPENAKHGYTTSRTCEIGLTYHSGISFKSIIYLVDKATEGMKNDE